MISNLFSLYFVYLEYLFISRFGFKSGIRLLIAPVPVHCFSITFIQMIRMGKSIRHKRVKTVLLTGGLGSRGIILLSRKATVPLLSQVFS